LPIDETNTSLKATLIKKVASDVARNPEGSMPAIKKAFDRTGDTRWQINNITLSNPKKLFISPTLLNTLRREILDALTAAFNKNQAVRQANILATINKNEIDGRLSETVTSIKKPCWNVKLRLDQKPFEGLENAAEIIVRISHVANRQYEQQWLIWHARNPQVKLRLALPLITRGIDNPALEATAAKWIQNGYASWECADLAGVIMLDRLSKKYGYLDLTSDWSLYTINKPAQTQLTEFGIKRYVVSPEENLHNLQQIISGPPSPEIIMFQHTPLFISATAPLSPLEFQYNENIIAISDRRGRQFKTIKIDQEYITIQESPYCLSDYFKKLVASGISWYRADFSFSVEPPETLITWWSDICSGKTVANSHTGNFLRGFL
jgi:hypothetical protein